MIGGTAVWLRRRLPAWPVARAIDRRDEGSRPGAGKWWKRASDMAVYRGEGRIAQERTEWARFHLGRGRLARDVGRFEEAAGEARRALVQQPLDPWAYALLGQALLRQHRPYLIEARRALEEACALSPKNGYFVGLLREVLSSQGDAAAQRELTERAWWLGAPVERWLERPPRQAPPAPAAARRPMVTPPPRHGAYATA